MAVLQNSHLFIFMGLLTKIYGVWYNKIDEIGGIFMDKFAALQYLKFINSLNSNNSQENQKYYDFLFWLKNKNRKNRRKRKNG